MFNPWPQSLSGVIWYGAFPLFVAGYLKSGRPEMRVASRASTTGRVTRQNRMHQQAQASAYEYKNLCSQTIQAFRGGRERGLAGAGCPRPVLAAGLAG